ncbi:PKD domain-containing protein [Methanobrevibacter sp.]|uniref:PKD domain-containing protein n=1 Tax=Methanobrevibacter sp. TaxID=66852 RepID=UPI0038704A5C
MSKKATRIFGISLFLIFFLLIGQACALENSTNETYESFQDYSTSISDEMNICNDSNVEILSYNNNCSENSLLSDSDAYIGDVFLNPDFEDGVVDSFGNVSGWIANDKQIRGENPQEYSSYNIKIVSGFNPTDSPEYNSNLLTYEGRALNVMPGTDEDRMFYQFINLDSVDEISFEYLRFTTATRKTGVSNFNVQIDDEIVESISSLEKGDHWNTITIDTTAYSGMHFFKIVIDSRTTILKHNLYFDNFTVKYNENVSSYFNYITSFNGDNIDIQFTNRATGVITNILWDFGDGTNSTEINPTKSFKSGEYNITLTVSNENNTAIYSQVLSLLFPSINGQIYKTMQEAIDNATDGDIIDVPVDLSESISIDKNLTLNFNGNKLISSGSSPVIQVTGGAQATIKNITFEDSNVVSTDDESSLTITESNIADTNITLNTGNIALDGNNFKGSFITVVNANAVIANNNIANGGIKVNGGKSKINNNVLSGNDVAITQTEGETNITSNIITDNNIGVNVTNGTANINFNVIYSNTNVSLAYIGSVDASNNWFGVYQATFSTTPSDEYVDVYAPNVEQPTWLVLTLNCNETTLSSAQNYTIGVDLTLNSKGENTSSLGTLPKFSLPVSTKLGQDSAVNIENSIGEFTLTTATLTSDDAIFTINGEDYTLDVNVFKIEDRIKELETQLVDAQANATKLAEDLADANQKVENLTTKLNETQANATKLADELKDANQKAENLTTQLGDAQKQIQTLSAELISTTVAAKDLSIKALTNGNIQVTLKANGTALANKTVNVIINGVTYNGTTGEDGVAKIAVKFASAGTYYATVTFAGDDTYKSSISTSKVVVSKKATKIAAPKKSFKAKVKTKKVKITLKSGSAVLKSKKITLKVNGKTYSAKTNSKGVATIKVTKLTKKGTFTYTVKFAGDKAYKAITKKGKMTIK